ncbi:TlpA family protein disulfide reductase [Winogradskyella sediminis]|uniref:Thiol-disulfide isomerase or thioredoxin n=1 Tax=Winogradskyella sediminis TaxID=1382466 RepID=A0A1H1WR83_9FLAO|nr:TlpA disulfide reductase family protein [Winogradskyella sediminis]SDS99663.1 Thiol-disulfide isomerase or thioredoxin [Winogradskyella sediminis]
MKRLLSLSIAISLFACKGEPKDYVTLSGKINNPDESKTLKIFKGRDYEKIIPLNDDGSFNDTLKVVAGDYNLQHGKEYGQIYLENDNESAFETDYNAFMDSMVFKGDASDLNNFSVQSFIISKTYFTEELVASNDMSQVDDAIAAYKSAYEDLKIKYTDVDSMHVSMMDMNIDKTVQQITKYMESKMARIKAFPKGSASPAFEDYENFAGGTTSLSDLKGKYVYIDLWATWCAPCIKEIPSLKALEKEYEGKNIEFVSISVDEGRGYNNDPAEAYKGWKKMINDKELGGIQLIADNGFRSQFIQDYKVTGIPRFLLIDPDGNIVSADAPRPSNSALISLFNELNI